MLENLRDHDRIFNAGDDLYCTTAELTSLDVDPEYPLKALCPRQGDVLPGFGLVLFGDALLATSGRGDLCPPATVRGEDAVEPGEINARPWHLGNCSCVALPPASLQSSAASRAMKSSGSKITCVVPSR